MGDARALDLADGSVDAVLLLGPLYHLRTAEERLAALGEARRVLRPGGVLFAAAISRWAPRLDAALREAYYRYLPTVMEELGVLESTGWMRPMQPGGFSAYCHRPDELAHEVQAAGFDLVSLVSVEGPASALSDLADRLADPEERRITLELVRGVESVPELLGVGPHLLASARRPG